jgi:hypothetical protein
MKEGKVMGKKWTFTEREWLASKDPQPMLYFLRNKGSDRKLRLFACACSRRIWELFEDPRCFRAIEVAEQFADGLATNAERKAAFSAIPGRSFIQGQTELLLDAGRQPAKSKGIDAAMHSFWTATGCLIFETTANLIKTERTTNALFAGFLRDVFGNPFHLLPLIPRKWRTPAVLARATAGYDNRILPAGTLDRDRLAVLADALEEAGCTDADILNHLRGPGPHVRGCHVIDALIDKS